MKLAQDGAQWRAWVLIGVETSGYISRESVCCSYCIESVITIWPISPVKCFDVQATKVNSQVLQIYYNEVWELLRAATVFFWDISCKFIGRI
jgi:predicted nucleic acid-binding Zn finger protein